MENTLTKAEKRAAKRALKKERKFSRVEKSWIMYDWANSIYATNIMAAIFPIYYAQIASERGNEIYGYAVSIANLVVAILAPILGAIGDFRGMKKKLFSTFLVIGVVFTTLMAVVSDDILKLLGIPGLEAWMLMLIGLIISRIGFSGSCLFYDSFLTDVTTSERMDRVSAWGYAMGYIGGSTIPFIISIVIMFLMNMNDLSFKLAILIVPYWWLFFSIPFLRNVHQTHYVDEKPSKLAREAFRNAGRTFLSICKDKGVLLFIIAYFFYIDGVDTIISMATNYGSTLGLGTIGMILALLVTQIVAVPFSILFGNLGRKKGGIKLISIAVIIYFIITIIGFFMGFNVEKGQMPYKDTIDAAYSQTVGEAALSGNDLAAFNKAFLDGEGNSLIVSAAVDSMPEDDVAAAFTEKIDELINSAECSETAIAAARQSADSVLTALNEEAYRAPYQRALTISNVLFWVLATLVGTVQGGIQALSRSFFGQIIPAERSNEYYGFMDIFGKFSCVIGPALYALVFGLTGRASLGILSIIILFFGGAITLFFGKKYFIQLLEKNSDASEQEETVIAE